MLTKWSSGLLKGPLMLSDIISKSLQHQAWKAKMKCPRLQNEWTTNSQECECDDDQRTKSKLLETVKLPRWQDPNSGAGDQDSEPFQNPGDQSKRPLVEAKPLRDVINLAFILLTQAREWLVGEDWIEHPMTPVTSKTKGRKGSLGKGQESSKDIHQWSCAFWMMSSCTRLCISFLWLL